MNDKDFPEKFRKVLGAKPGDVIEIATPQFERPPNMPEPTGMPINMAEWVGLTHETKEQLIARGIGNWNGGLFLFPGEWYDHVPDKLIVECVVGGRSKWGAEKRDRDIRYGCLAYGIRIGNSKPSPKSS